MGLAKARKIVVNDATYQWKVSRLKQLTVRTSYGKTWIKYFDDDYPVKPSDVKDFIIESIKNDLSYLEQ